MFTGLIQSIGSIESIKKDAGDTVLVVQNRFNMHEIELGASIACSGVCLTVTKKGKDWFEVEVSAETLSKTNIGTWEQGDNINLERSLTMGAELGGHFVFGHVDGLASLEGIEPAGDSHVLTIKPADDMMRYIAPKGSIALDGVSLTVNDVLDEAFQVNIIAHTWKHTTLSEKKLGDKLHIEIDMLARYVERMLSYNKESLGS